ADATSSGDAKRPVDEKPENQLQIAKINVFDPVGVFWRGRWWKLSGIQQSVWTTMYRGSG
ncbi:MAG: hypothetical protein ACPHN1_06560, partial [Candidatus Puniceispirillaceae bacterium]